QAMIIAFGQARNDDRPDHARMCDMDRKTTPGEDEIGLVETAAQQEIVRRLALQYAAIARFVDPMDDVGFAAKPFAIVGAGARKGRVEQAALAGTDFDGNGLAGRQRMRADIAADGEGNLLVE